MHKAKIATKQNNLESPSKGLNLTSYKQLLLVSEIAQFEFSANLPYPCCTMDSLEVTTSNKTYNATHPMQSLW